MSKFFNPFESEIIPDLIPLEFNNPFDVNTSEICKIAVKEVQAFLISQKNNWEHDFGFTKIKTNYTKGKMFGVLVVRNQNDKLGYLFTVSGKLTDKRIPKEFVPSLFDDSIDDFFINRGMSELTDISNQIKGLDSKRQKEINALKTERKNKSALLQQKLFDQYNFLNIKGDRMNICKIFKNSLGSKPPAAAGECAAPKLIQFALENNMKLISIAEFWWGSPKGQSRIHKEFYPACRDKCRPILEFMLNDNSLYDDQRP